MRAKRETAIVEDPRFFDHRGPPDHPERPDRLAAVSAAVEARSDRLKRLAPRPALPEEILRVHSREHLDGIAEACQRAPGHLDPDTFVSPESFDIACLAAGGTIDLVRQVARGELATGLAAVRPPGHHAESERAMGFCLFNNIAIAARAVQVGEGVDRILILDWDVHHGNGTQHFFEADPSILYASTHQFPFYPGTGAAGESGVGPGEGYTLNIPLPAGCGDTEYVGALEHLLAPAARAFAPEMILISCGFDAHRDDPLAAMEVTAEGFQAMASILRGLADDLCGGRLALVLEGGYSALGLREGVDAVLNAIQGADPTPVPSVGAPIPGSVLEAVVERVSTVHGCDFPRL